MPRRLVLILIALGLTIALTAAPVAAGGLGTLDQQQTTVGNTHAVLDTLTPAQIFTAGLTGQLDHVDLYIAGFTHNPFGSGTPGDDLTVEIWTVTGGVPDSPVPGASATVVAADAPASPAWVQVPISAPSVAGTQYAIVLASPGSNDCDPETCWLWLMDESAPYAGGAAYTSNDGGATWNPVALNTQAADFAFRTYVTPPAPTPAASNLPNAAMDRSTDTSPLLALGFAALLLGSLGTLAFANTRRR